MILTARRFLVLVALMFWQGGFTFYAAVVVPISSKAIGSLDQGFITFQVTGYLNIAGIAAVLILGSDAHWTNDPDRRRRGIRWISWGVLVLGLIVLFGLREWLAGFMDLENVQVFERKTFRIGHRTYLWMSTIQWAATLVYMWCTLRGWSAEDSAKR